MAASERIAEIVRPIVEAAGLDLVEASVSPAGKRRIVRIVIDNAVDGELEITRAMPPVSLDAIAEISPRIGSALDAGDALGPTPYTLEITSPGVGRPLMSPRDFQRQVTRQLDVVMSGGGRFTGRVISAGPTHARVQVGDLVRTLDYAEVAKAHVVVEFNRPASHEEEE